MTSHGGGPAIRALIASLAVLLPAGMWAAATVDNERATTVVTGGRAGATSFGDAALLEEAPSPGTPAVTTAPVTTSTTRPPSTPTTKASAPTTSSTTRAPAIRKPATTTTTVDLPAFMKANPNPPGYLAAASAWEAKGDGVSVRMHIEPASPVAGEPVRMHLEYTGGDACCIVEVRFGDGSPFFSANNDPPCVKSGSLSPGTHRTVVTHTYDMLGTYRAQVRILDGDLCTPTPIFHHVEMFACIAVGPGTPLTPGCDPLPTYGPYSPQ
jgi:hypothetical protein